MNKTVRCKLTLTEIRENSYGHKTLVFSAVYDSSIPEDQRFYKATPTGRLEMQVDNPSALEFFQLGNQYYFDASSAPLKPAG